MHRTSIISMERLKFCAFKVCSNSLTNIMIITHTNYDRRDWLFRSLEHYLIIIGILNTFHIFLVQLPSMSVYFKINVIIAW